MEVQRYKHFECGNAIKIHDRIMFDFYPGLSHIDKFLELNFLY